MSHIIFKTCHVEFLKLSLGIFEIVTPVVRRNVLARAPFHCLHNCTLTATLGASKALLGAIIVSEYMVLTSFEYMRYGAMLSARSGAIAAWCHECLV